jgi:hypothetical protein
LDVIIILSKKAPKIFEDLIPFKGLPIDAELLSQSQCGHHCRFPLLSPFNPNLVLFQEPVEGVKRVNLHPTSFASIILTLLGKHQ